MEMRPTQVGERPEALYALDSDRALVDLGRPREQARRLGIVLLLHSRDAEIPQAVPGLLAFKAEDSHRFGQRRVGGSVLLLLDKKNGVGKQGVGEFEVVRPEDRTLGGQGLLEQSLRFLRLADPVE